MTEIDELRTRLDNDNDIDSIRRAIVDLIATSLDQKRDVFGYWEKAQFAQAIAALEQNLQSGNADSTAWLRLCLVNIENAHVPPDARSEDFTSRIQHIDALTFDQLREHIRNLGG